MNEIVDVAVPVGIRKTFAYSVPKSFREKIAPGMRILVPFGRKVVTGYVIGSLTHEQVGAIRLKAVQDLLEPKASITPALVETALWVSRHYFAPPGEVFRALFPAGSQISGERTASLTAKTATLLQGGLRPVGLQPQEEALLAILAEEPSLSVKELVKRSGVRGGEAWVESLAAAQWIQLEMHMEAPKVKVKEQLGIRSIEGDAAAIAALPAAQQRLYRALEDGSEILPLQEVLKTAHCSRSAVHSLERKGLAAVAPWKIERTPEELAPAHKRPALNLTSYQQELVDGVLELMAQKRAARCLVHGVTGSGKTEVYLRLIAETLRMGQTALFLVPEIGLTPMLSRLVVSRFPGQVSLLHSGMSAGERFDQWSRIRDGAAQVVVGTRSAVFAPLQHLRLIVIDEEQDGSYKQDESPCYHAREVAWQRMQQSQGVLVLGSATPSIETFHLAAHKKDAAYFHIPERVQARPMPQVTIVHMGQEFQRAGKNVIISEPLATELSSCMERGEQAIVLLNRRGFARTLLCRSCGHVYVCPDCSISMTYHRQDNRLVCHYCGQEDAVPSLCTNCGGAYIHYSGVGTEQLESMLQEMLPTARIARLDRDTTRKRGVMRSTLFSFSERKLDILVGTQMLAKGHDFPDVTLVGVVAADAGLSFPDFRSAERTFQLLIQVAGRAGRGTMPGRVVIQSYYPDNYALQFARKQDYVGFYDQEIEFRKMMGYPPYRDLIQILVSDPDYTKATKTAERIAAAIRQRSAAMPGDEKTHVLGPAAAPIEKLRGNYRIQILLKHRPGANAVTLLHECFEELGRGTAPAGRIHVDVDPLSLL